MAWNTADMSTSRGTAGNDTVRATNDTDGTILRSGTGDDVLVGGRYDDILIGGAGDDMMAGGGGADQFRFLRTQYEGDVTYDGDPGSDLDRITDLNFGEGDWIVFDDYGAGMFEDAEGVNAFDGGNDAIVSSFKGLVNIVEDSGGAITVTGDADLDLLIIKVNFGTGIQELRISNAFADYTAAAGGISL